MVFDIDDIQNKQEAELIQKLSLIGTASSEALAAHIVLYRTLKMNKDVAQAAMLELARRRSFGDDFNYESYIEEKIKTIPIVKPLDIKSAHSLLNIQSISNLIPLKK